MNEKPPLGLPQHSVRAILALMLVGSFIAAIFFKVAGEALAALAALAGTAVTFYFETRKNSNSQ